jgi:hypothetical protein
MADDDGGFELVWGLMLVMLAVAAAVAAVMALMSVGAAYGAGTALVNYGRSLKESVQPERAAT